MKQSLVRVASSVFRGGLWSLIVSALIQNAACGNTGKDTPYKPLPAYSGPRPNLPPAPSLPTTPIKSGDSYTVYGASHHLLSPIHSKEVRGKELTIEGYIVETNILSAPACALHPQGKKDPEGCVTDIPSFWIADSKTETVKKIRVLGWASYFASVYDAMRTYRNLKEPPKNLVKDKNWGGALPFPLPAVGAKVKVTGTYGTVFSKSSTGIVSDPLNGILTYSKMDVIEPASSSNK